MPTADPLTSEGVEVNILDRSNYHRERGCLCAQIVAERVCLSLRS